MEENKILPIGTVVSLKNADNVNVMIISRCISLTFDENSYYFEYSGCLLPKGLVGNGVASFNTEDIKEVIYQGFIDDEELTEQQNILEWLKSTTAQKANTQLINAIMAEKNKRESASKQE